MAETGNGFQTATNHPRVGYSVILLTVLITGLIGYKGYSGLTKLHPLRASGTLELRDDLLRTSMGSAKFGFLARAVEYLQIVWPALLFGILIAGAVHAFVSPAWLVRRLGEGGVREQVTSGCRLPWH